MYTKDIIKECTYEYDRCVDTKLIIMLTCHFDNTHKIFYTEDEFKSYIKNNYYSYKIISKLHKV